MSGQIGKDRREDDTNYPPAKKKYPPPPKKNTQQKQPFLTIERYCKATIFSKLLNLAKLAMTYKALNILFAKSPLAACALTSRVSCVRAMLKAVLNLVVAKLRNCQYAKFNSR